MVRLARTEMGLDVKVGEQILWGLQQAETLVNLERVEARQA